MSWKLKTENSVWIGIIAGYLSIIASLITIFFSENLRKNLEENLLYLILAFIGVIAFPFIIVLLYRLGLYLWEKRQMTNRKLSGFILEKQKITIDISNEGKEAYYVSKTVFCDAGRGLKGKKTYERSVSVAYGTITPLSELNCKVSVNRNKDSMKVEYKDATSKLNEYKSIVPEQDKFLMSSALFTDVFVKKQENWNLKPQHYCKNYIVEITLPAESKLKHAEIYKIITNENGAVTEELLENIPPIITRTNGRDKIIMQIVDYDYPETLSLKWEID